jgi:hypothetical protein
LIIKLEKDEVRICSLLAIERWLTKFDSIDRPNYARGKEEGKLEPELNANIRANVCEWAVAKHYNLSWNLPWYPNQLHTKRYFLADVGNNIEVRSVRTKTSIPIWGKDKGKIIVGTKCLDEEFYTSVKIYGCIKSDNFMNEQYFDEPIEGWRVPVNLFREQLD